MLEVILLIVILVGALTLNGYCDYWMQREAVKDGIKRSKD